MLGAQQTRLLRAGPKEADPVARLDVEPLEDPRGLEVRRRAGAVVVDRRAVRSRVHVGADDDGAVRIALRVRDHVVRRPRLGDRLRGDAQHSAGRRELLAGGERRTHHRDGDARAAERAAQEAGATGIVAVVEDDHRACAGRLRVERLGGERAGPSLQERDVAGGEAREVRRLAPARHGRIRGLRQHEVDGLHRRGHVAGARVVHRDEVRVRGERLHARSDPLEGRRGRLPEERELEVLNRWLVADVAQLAHDVLRRRLVAGRPRKAIARAGIRVADRLERTRVLQHAFDRERIANLRVKPRRGLAGAACALGANDRAARAAATAVGVRSTSASSVSSDGRSLCSGHDWRRC